jgi:pantetheine-phosphate adenylyltransferase
MKRIAIYPGSFDPITNGHVDIIDRALRVFDEVIVLVAINLKKTTSKSTWFDPDERVKLIQTVFQNNPRVRVDICTGLVVEYAKKNKVSAIVRGLRAASDFESEFMMAAINRELDDGVETFFLMTGTSLYFVSSTVLKEVSVFGGDVRAYVPKPVWQAVQKKIKEGKSG